MTKQLKNGKAFEYALLKALEEKLILHSVEVDVIDSSELAIAKECFLTSGIKEQEEFDLCASSAINFIIDVEPRLAHAIDHKDILELQIMPDATGESGDVRDVLAIRKAQEWEIGISAKNNHKAVKHSRLSKNLDFGERWLGIPCSPQYFEDIAPVFDGLEELRKSNPSMKWSEFKNKSDKVYLPVLNAFIDELNRLSRQYRTKVASGLVAYLIGRKDFYKVIKQTKKVQIQGFNIQGTLSPIWTD